MDEKKVRLTGCFLAVFPEISAREITKASSNSVQNWDSMASVALLTEVEEEFGIIIEGDDLARFNSFEGFLNYLHETENDGQVSGDRDV